MKKITLILSSTIATATVAHDGHGLGGSAHWHATDALGFVVAAALVAVAFYFGKK
ncbi:hypothetical protein [Limnohabitans sp.]|jgi:hypothetical protein|uniref:hypothetical protein n=1 Tax=Limnohabitans sp. TaxID=1907725 RepID=UPI0025C0A756|nr:hypothetical protein [Limnohabitans sp.]